jgi:chromosome segregation ATPase
VSAQEALITRAGKRAILCPVYLRDQSVQVSLQTAEATHLLEQAQHHSPSSEHSTPTSASSGYPDTHEKQDSDLKSYLMMLVEDIKKGFNNSLKEIQENTAKEVEVLKEIQENKTKQVMELNKPNQVLKREMETIKKTQNETTLEIEDLGKKYGAIDSSISNRIQEMEERISGAKDSRENMGTTIKENAKCKKI